MIESLIKKFKTSSIQKETVENFSRKSKNDLISSESIILNEKVKGNIYCLEEVTIDINGSITGNIRSKSCIVNGKVKGNILCAEYIDVKNTARIEGNIKAVTIEIEPGSIINGFINIDKKIRLSTLIKKMEEEIAGKGENIEIKGEDKKTEERKTEDKKIEDKKIEERKIEDRDLKPSAINATEIPQAPPELTIQPKSSENNVPIIEESPKKINNPLPSNDSWW